MLQPADDERLQRVAVLRDPALHTGKGTVWDKFGHTCNELSELYQIAKERRLDLVLFDDSRSDLTPRVVARLRRTNGLMEVWKIVDDDLVAEPEPEYLDGTVMRSAGDEHVVDKVHHILRIKELLRRYGIVGRSARMKALAETIERVAPSDMAILIVGPSGSGKELVARAVHSSSKRAEYPYVTINCGALAPGVLESELFGHEKGAFTGSVGRREGLFGKADGGTLFLDEIGETSPDMQVKLLRVLEDGTYYPVGSSVAHRSNLRIVSATNRDLTEAIADRTFREDLYFRLAVVKISLPPLLERKGDILPLLEFFWREDLSLTLSDSALELLVKYDWPGNVRQLRNFAERMLALKGKGLVEVGDVQRFLDEQYVDARHLPVTTGKTVEEAGHELIYHAILSLGNEVRMLRDLITAHLPSEEPTEASEESAVIGKVDSLEAMEEELIKSVLEKTGGNRKEAARILGVGERTLYRKLKKYQLN